MVNRQRLVLILFVCVFAIFALRQHFFVDRYAVDVLYWDSWELYRPLFYGGNWWISFDFQYGPHRQGVGGILMRVLAPASHWNSRCDAFSVSFALMAAVPPAAWLAFRCGVREWAILFVPAIYLNIRQCFMFIVSANPSHGALPVLMFTAYCAAFFIRRHGVRLIIQSLLIFLLIFTGFGLFAGLIAPVVLIFEFTCTFRGIAPTRKRRLAEASAAMVAIALSWLLFARGYRFDPAVSGFRFPYEHPIEYLYFIGAMLGNYFGIGQGTPVAVGLGLIVLACLTCICIFHFWQLIKAKTELDYRSVVLFCLSSYVLFFCTQSAIGRTFLGWQTGASSRYVTLMIPAGLALLIQLSIIPAMARRQVPLIYGCLLVLSTFSLHQREIAAAEYLHNKCLDWRLAYLQTHDQTTADQLANFPINPNNVTGRLDYLQARKLNLFDRDAFKGDARIEEPKAVQR